MAFSRKERLRKGSKSKRKKYSHTAKKTNSKNLKSFDNRKKPRKIKFLKHRLRIKSPDKMEIFYKTIQLKQNELQIMKKLAKYSNQHKKGYLKKFKGRYLNKSICFPQKRIKVKKTFGVLQQQNMSSSILPKLRQNRQNCLLVPPRAKKYTILDQHLNALLFPKKNQVFNKLHKMNE